MILSHKIQLLPTNEQVVQFEKACGCARFSYNWGLNKWQKMYSEWKGNNTLPKPNANLIKKLFNEIKEVEFPWIYDSPKDANQQSFTNLNKSFKNFFNKTSKYPQFKSKHKNKHSFYISNDKFSISEFEIKLPLIGEVKLTEKLRFEGEIQSCSISKSANKWFASISVDVSEYKKERISNNSTSIDLGFSPTITEINGTIKSTTNTNKLDKKLKRNQHQLSKKVKKSNNYKKQIIKVQKLYSKIHNIKLDFIHKYTTQLCRENQSIIIEDLSVKSMMKKYGKSVLNHCLGEYKRQLDYKSKIYNNKLIIIDRWYPSSQVCSNCGYKHSDLELSDRTFVCPNCKISIDRNLNACYNLNTLGQRGINACGDGCSIYVHYEPKQLPSMKQELLNVNN